MIKYLDKRVFVQLNGSRKVIGTLRGYDVSVCRLWEACTRLTSPQVFLNIVLDDAIEEKNNGEKVRMGQAVCGSSRPLITVLTSFRSSAVTR